MSEMDDVTIPGEPKPDESALIRNLTIVAGALTAAGIAVNLMLQIAHFLKKKPVQPDQRDRIQAAGLAITVLKHVPGLVKQVRLVVNQIKRAA